MKNSNNTGKKIVALVGDALGVQRTPDKGKATREKIVGAAQDIAKELKEKIKGDAESLRNSIHEKMDDLKDHLNKKG